MISYASLQLQLFWELIFPKKSFSSEKCECNLNSTPEISCPFRCPKNAMKGNGGSFWAPRGKELFFRVDPTSSTFLENAFLTGSWVTTHLSRAHSYLDYSTPELFELASVVQAWHTTVASRAPSSLPGTHAGVRAVAHEGLRPIKSLKFILKRFMARPLPWGLDRWWESRQLFDGNARNVGWNETVDASSGKSKWESSEIISMEYSLWNAPYGKIPLYPMRGHGVGCYRQYPTPWGAISQFTFLNIPKHFLCPISLHTSHHASTTVYRRASSTAWMLTAVLRSIWETVTSQYDEISSWK